MALCEVKMYPMKLERGTCEKKGFTCEKVMPTDSKIFSGMREFDLPPKVGNCSVNLTTDVAATMDPLVTQEAAIAIVTASTKADPWDQCMNEYCNCISVRDKMADCQHCCYEWSCRPSEPRCTPNATYAPCKPPTAVVV